MCSIRVFSTVSNSYLHILHIFTVEWDNWTVGANIFHNVFLMILSYSVLLCSVLVFSIISNSYLRYPYLRIPSTYIRTCVFHTCIFHTCKMSWFILRFPILVFSNTCDFSAPLSGSRVVLLMLPWTTAAATWFPILEPSVYTQDKFLQWLTQRTYFCRFQVRCYLWRNGVYCNLYGVSLITREE